MSPFRRRERLSPDFIAVPAEQTVVPAEVRIADLDTQAYQAFRAGDTAKADRLLDLRNAIRPGRPREVPGRVDSIIDNDWENP